MAGILDYKDKLEECRCLVIGDVMLDEYVTGRVERISPEAPVPVIEVEDTRLTLGGAANVAKGIRRLCAGCVLVGAVGQDADADALKKELDRHGIRWAGMDAASRVTTKKTRIVGNQRQLARLDKEVSLELSGQDARELMKKIEEEVGETDVLIISDYRKGVCSPDICRQAIQLAREYGVKVIVDPKCPDWSRYSGAYLIKPNLKEYYEAIGGLCADIIGAARPLLNKYGISNILVTRSQDGMTLIGEEGEGDYQAQTHEVFDVSGAGDTVISVIAALTAAGMPLPEAVHAANVAAGIAVSKLGTYAVGIDEIAGMMGLPRYGKLVGREEIAHLAVSLRAQGKKIVFTNGCFDILHAGHVSLLEQAKRQGDILVVGLNSDDSVRRLKGPKRPINSEMDRVRLLSSMETVDAVVIFDEDTPQELIKELLPDVIVKGADYSIDEVVGADIVRKNGGRVVLASLLQGRSTTRIAERQKLGGK